MRLKMETPAGFNQRQFWSENEEGKRNTPLNFSMIMTRDRFETILRHLSFTKANLPPCKDRMFEHRAMEAQWNNDMMEQHTPSDISTLDESMKKWVNQYACPAFMVVHRKP